MRGVLAKREKEQKFWGKVEGAFKPNIPEVTFDEEGSLSVAGAEGELEPFEPKILPKEQLIIDKFKAQREKQYANETRVANIGQKERLEPPKERAPIITEPPHWRRDKEFLEAKPSPKERPKHSVKLGAPTIPDIGGTAQLALVAAHSLGLFQDPGEKKWNAWQKNIKFSGNALMPAQAKQESHRLNTAMETMNKHKGGILVQKEKEFEAVHKQIVDHRNELFSKKTPVAEATKRRLATANDAINAQIKECSAMRASLFDAKEKLKERGAELSEEDVKMFDAQLEKMTKEIRDLNPQPYDKRQQQLKALAEASKIKSKRGGLFSMFR